MNEIIAEGMHNDQRVITVKSISGDPITLNEKIAEVVVDTGNGKQRCIAVKQLGGGGGGGTDDYTDLENKPKINNVTLSGNKTSSDLSLQDALVSGTNIKTINSTSLLGSGDISITVPVTDVEIAGESVLSSGVANLTSTNMAGVVRGVSPACTTITASDTTATLTANTTYAHALSSSGCTYTLTTPSDLTVYSGFILMIDTTNSASIAFQTDDSPTPASIALNGNPTISTGKRYTVTGQYSVLNNAWELWIIEYNAS